MSLPLRILPGLGGFKTLSFNHILPNLVTLLALSAGLTAIRYGLRGEFQNAVIALMVAALLDAIDGRIARFLRSSSKFGAELDSLSDIVCFGATPALLLYMWTMDKAGGIGWALCVLFPVCCALRLARFNTMLGEPDLPPYAYNYFVGTPAPAGAFLTMLPMVLSFEFGDTFFASPWLSGIVLCVTSFLMISRIPTFALKRFRIPAPWALPLMLTVGIIASLFVTEPWITLGILGGLYLMSIPVAASSYLKLRERTSQQTPHSSDIREPEPPSE